MRIVLSIPDSLIQPLSDYLATQKRPVVDPQTGQPVMVPIHASRAAFIQQQVTMLLKGIVRQHPPPAVQQRLAAIEAAEQAIEQVCQVTAQEEP